MARQFSPPRKVRVRLSEASEPASLFWRGRWEPVRVRNRWRREDDWWRLGGEIQREYYRLQTASAVVCVIFRDALADDWYLESVLD